MAPEQIREQREGSGEEAREIEGPTPTDPAADSTEPGSAPTTSGPTTDATAAGPTAAGPAEQARTQVEQAEEADDEARLEVLDRLYEALEHDLDQASASGR